MKVLTLQELRTKIQNKESFIVDMYPDWCGPCRVLGPIVERVANKFENDNSPVGVYKFDIETDKQLASELNVRSIPTIKAFKNGELVDTKIGVIQENQLIEMANSVL